MSAEFKFEDQGLTDFIKNLNRGIGDVKDGKRAYVSLISAIVFRDVMEHFDKEQGETEKWEPWSDIYRQHMQRIGRAGNKLLQFNGRLRQNFKPTDYKTSAEGIYWFNNARTSSGFPYAEAHDEGGGQLPQREFMWASEKAVEEMAEQTLAFILQEKV